MMRNDVKGMVKDHFKRLNLSEELHMFSFLVQVVNVKLSTLTFNQSELDQNVVAGLILDSG